VKSGPWLTLWMYSGKRCRPKRLSCQSSPGIHELRFPEIISATSAYIATCSDLLHPDCQTKKPSNHYHVAPNHAWLPNHVLTSWLSENLTVSHLKKFCHVAKSSKCLVAS